MYMAEMWQLAIKGNLQGVWFWAAVYALLVCSYSITFQLRIRRWPETVGTLHRIGIKKFGAMSNERSEQSYASNGLYHYKVNNQSYRGTRISPWIFVVNHNAKSVLNHQLNAINYVGENEVKVFHHPTKPDKSYLIKPGLIGMLVTLICALLPFAGYLFRFYL